jgi:RNA polymerase sigma-70 factor (ECF subfamily)
MDRRDGAAYDAFYTGSWGRLFGQACVLTGDRETAQDLTQEALLRAWRRWDRIAGFEDPEGWTRRVLHNLCIESWRRNRTRMAHRPVEAPPSPDVPVHHHQLAQAMRDLPGDQARALLLHDGLGMTVPETAAELAVPEGTVRSWLSRSRKVVAARITQSEQSEQPPVRRS